MTLNDSNSKRAFLLALLIIICYLGILSLTTWHVSKNNTTALKAELNNKETANNAIDNKRTLDTTVSLLRSGDIVLRAGSDAFSHLLSLMNTRDKTFSHCGIVILENGYPFVYHSIGGEDNPDERLRSDSACFFLSPAHSIIIGVVRYNRLGDSIKALTEIVNIFYKSRPKFDLDFDLRTDDKLYCSEFVYKAVNKAMGDTGFIKTTTAYGHTYVAIDDLFLNSHATLIWKVAYK